MNKKTAVAAAAAPVGEPVTSGPPMGAPMFAIVGKAPERHEPLPGSAPATSMEELAAKLRAKQKSEQEAGPHLSEDDAFGQSVKEFRGRHFRVVHPTLFQRRDMLRALGAVQKTADGMDGITDDLEKLEAAAMVQEHQIKIVLPVLEILDEESFKFRAATMDEAGYHIDDEALAELIAIVLPQTTPKAEVEKAGLDAKK